MPTIPGYRLFRHLFIDTGAPAYLAWVRLRLKATGGITLTATPDADGLGGELNINGSGVGPSPSNTTPAALGVGAPGALATYSRGDHIHPMPSAADVGADAAGAAASAVALEAGARAAADALLLPTASYNGAVYAWPAHRTGKWRVAGRLTYSSTTDAAAFALAIGEWRCFPILEPSSTTITDVGVRVSTSVAGGKILMAVYEDSDGYPGALVASVEVDCASTGARTGTINAARSKDKRYWLCAHISSSTLKVYSCSINDCYNVGVDAITAGKGYVGWYLAGSGSYSATPPNPFTAGAAVYPAATTSMPLHFYKV